MGNKAKMVQDEPAEPAVPPSGTPPNLTSASKIPTARIVTGQTAEGHKPESDGPDTNPSVASPPWAKDLRQLYDAVVEEPLPDSFLDLLSQLDTDD
jgi:hypothetical protein